MLRDVYADDNCWLLAIDLGYDLPAFLDSGFTEMRRELLGVFLYYFFLPFRFLDNPYIVWHSIVVATQIATTLIMFKLVQRIAGDTRIAALTAAAFVVLPLDHALPYLSSFNYRGAFLLGLASLYLTDKAAERGKWGWQLPAAAALGVLAAYFLSEAMVALEPARLALLWFRFRPGAAPRAAARTTLRWFAPFIAVILPLVAYKLLLKPYGIYGGMYQTGLGHFFDWRNLAHAARLFLFGEWWLLRRVVSFAHPLTPLLALAAAVLVFAAFTRLRARVEQRDAPVFATGARQLAVFALVVLVGELGLFFYAGRPPKLGFDSTHAIFAQLGYAALLGLGAHWLLRWGAEQSRRFTGVALLLAAVGGAGIYFNNLRLDMFQAASAEQQRFWQVFRERFPQLPASMDWFIDAYPKPYRRKFESYFEWEDLHASYDLEFVLNRLYRVDPPRRARGHRVYTLQEARGDFSQLAPPRLSQTLRRPSHFGVDDLQPGSMIVVYYRGDRLLINEEIVRQDPLSPYRQLADKPVPPFARAMERP